MSVYFDINAALFLFLLRKSQNICHSNGLLLTTSIYSARPRGALSKVPALITPKPVMIIDLKERRC